MHKQITVIDLDGTFVSVNTFHHWMKFVLITSVKKRHFKHTLRILQTALLRLQKKITHAQMKYAILQCSEEIIHPDEIKVFVTSLKPYVNSRLHKVVTERTDRVILATAAPKIYADLLGERYGFDHCIATPGTQNNPWEENLKEKKRDNLFALLDRLNLEHRIDRFYTDHHDDLPLMEIANEVTLVNPSPKTKTIQIVEAHHIDYQKAD